jgi:hypothetical protein
MGSGTKRACKAGACAMEREGFAPCPCGKCVEVGPSMCLDVEALWHCPACGNEFLTSPGFTGPGLCSCGAGNDGTIMDLAGMMSGGEMLGDQPRP